MEHTAKLSQKRVMLLTIVLLSIVLFALVANYIRLQQVATNSRAAEIGGGGLIPTPSISTIISACGKTSVNCNKLKPLSASDPLTGLVPLDSLMYCVLQDDRKDAVCAYRAKLTTPACPTTGKGILTGLTKVPPDSSLHCLSVYQSPATSMCQIRELRTPGTGAIPTSAVVCQQLATPPTVLPRRMVQ
jgi:hypothetical protein